MKHAILAVLVVFSATFAAAQVKELRTGREVLWDMDRIAALDGGAREGWIRFGQPPSKITPRQGPEHYVKPKPGRLVLFPSYMWHGTEPFTTEESRLTMAFDVAPA